MATFNPRTYSIDLSREDREALFKHETPLFISHFWEWISAGKLHTKDETPEVPKVNILK